jgi:hypothetical protein
MMALLEPLPSLDYLENLVIRVDVEDQAI